jgi:tetratricopeptide (TPR) repeat protein
VEHFQKASLLMDTERFDLADREFQLHLAKFPDSSCAMALRAFCLCQLDRQKEALPLARKAHHLAPDDHYPHIALWTVLSQLGQKPKEREEVLRKALHIAPQDAQTWGFLGLEYVWQHRTTEALEAALTGLKIDPEDHSCLECQSLVYLNEGRFELALGKVDETLSLQPEHALGHGLRAMAHFARGELEAGEKSLNDALELDPNSPVNHHLWRLTSGLHGKLFRLAIKLRAGPRLWIFPLLGLFLLLRSVTPEYPTYSQLPLTLSYHIVEIALIMSLMIAPGLYVTSSLNVMKRSVFVLANLIGTFAFAACGDFVEGGEFGIVICSLFLLAALTHALYHLENIPTYPGARGISLALFLSGVGVAGAWLHSGTEPMTFYWAVLGVWCCWYGWYSRVQAYASRTLASPCNGTEYDCQVGPTGAKVD